MARMREPLGSKIITSGHKSVVVEMMLEGRTDTYVRKELAEVYSFSVSAPTIANFRKNFYEKARKDLELKAQKFYEKEGQLVKNIKEKFGKNVELVSFLADTVDSINKRLEKVQRWQDLTEHRHPAWESTIANYYKQLEVLKIKLYQYTNSANIEHRVEKVARDLTMIVVEVFMPLLAEEVRDAAFVEFRTRGISLMKDIKDSIRSLESLKK